MAGMLETWVRPVAQNILATAIIAVGTAICVWLASMTTLIALFAPLSYFFVALFAFIFMMLCLILVKWWRGFGLQGSATPNDHEELRHRIEKIEKAPHETDLEQRIGNAEGRILHLLRLSPPLNGLEARLERLERHASIVEGRERDDLANKISVMVRETHMPRPKAEERDVGPQIDRAIRQSQAVAQIWGELNGRGILDIVWPSLQEAEKAVIADAKKFVFEGDDALVWRSQDEKRQWHVNEAQLDALQEKVKEIQSREWNRR